MIDPQVLTGLERAVEDDPTNRPLHLHLIALLLADGIADRALGHAHWLLLHQPDNATAHLCAAQACDALGDEERAAAHRRCGEALEQYREVRS